MILSTGGGCTWCGPGGCTCQTPPRTRYPPSGPRTPPRPGTPPRGPGTPPGTRYNPPDTDNTWPVRIPLECILVFEVIKQECIPVGCVLSAAVTVSLRGGWLPTVGASTRGGGICSGSVFPGSVCSKGGGSACPRGGGICHTHPL